MTNTQVWTDSLTHCLDRAGKFYKPRHWSTGHNKVWSEALAYFKVNEIQDAFREYFKVGSHMPKPAEIINLIRELHPKQKAEHQELEAEVINPAGPIITEAWVRLNKLQSAFVFSQHSAVVITDDQAVLICNLEAKRLNFPDSIKPMFWLEEIWGFNKPDRTTAQMQESLAADRSACGEAPDYSYLLEV